MRQRTVVSLAVVIAGLVYLLAGRSLTAADLSSTGSLLFAGSTTQAIGMMAGASVVAVLLGLLASATGNPLAGSFVVGAALVFAAAGGTVDPWMRHTDIPSAYWSLLVEAGLWMLLGMAILAAVRFARDRLREKLPAMLRADHFDGALPSGLPTLQMQMTAAGGLPVVAVVAALLLQTSVWRSFAAVLVIALGLQGVLWGVSVLVMRAQRNGDSPAPGAMLGGFVAVAVSATVMLLMLRTTDVGQVIAAIAIGSMLGALAGGQLCPRTPVAMILLAPMTVAVGAYATIAFSYQDEATVLRAAWHTLNATPGANFDHLLSLGLALPIHYASSGLAGAALGLGWSQALFAARMRPHVEVAAA